MKKWYKVKFMVERR